MGFGFWGRGSSSDWRDLRTANCGRSLLSPLYPYRLPPRHISFSSFLLVISCLFLVHYRIDLVRLLGFLRNRHRITRRRKPHGRPFSPLSHSDLPRSNRRDLSQCSSVATSRRKETPVRTAVRMSDIRNIGLRSSNRGRRDLDLVSNSLGC